MLERQISQNILHDSGKYLRYFVITITYELDTHDNFMHKGKETIRMNKPEI